MVSIWSLPIEAVKLLIPATRWEINSVKRVQKSEIERLEREIDNLAERLQRVEGAYYRKKQLLDNEERLAVMGEFLTGLQQAKTDEERQRIIGLALQSPVVQRLLGKYIGL